jgi:hypothetical protein
MKQGKRVRATDSQGRPVRGIYLRDGRFIAGFETGGKWRMRTLDAATLTEARRERESLLAGLREGRTPAPDSLSVRDLFDDYRQARDLSARTDAHERETFDRYLGAIATRRAQEVSASELASVLHELRNRGLSGWTRHQVLRVLRGTFAHGVRRGVLSRSPADGLAPSERPPQRNAREVEVLAADALARLVEAAQDRRGAAGRAARPGAAAPPGRLAAAFPAYRPGRSRDHDRAGHGRAGAQHPPCARRREAGSGPRCDGRAPLDAFAPTLVGLGAGDEWTARDDARAARRTRGRRLHAARLCLRPARR